MSLRILPNHFYRRAWSKGYTHRPVHVLSRWQSTKQVKPLRVLFCGADHFSCASLRAVQEEQQRDPSGIASVDVLCRPGKPTGRGLKTIREVPLKQVAQELGLTIHERDTFTGWNLPQPDGENINLIIAVSFGLFVPPRILKNAEYGGVNIHPSFLPEFRGPAPLHHMLLANEKHIGVTLQTLHPERFDHGAILSQTSRPGFEIPNASECTYPELLEFIAPKAADFLVQGLRDRVFVPPIRDISFSLPQQDPNTLRHAPKITIEDRHINWDTMTASEICRRDRVIGRLWDFYQPEGEEKKRIVFHGLKVVETPQVYIDWLDGNKDVEAEIKGLPIASTDGKSTKGPPFVKMGKAIVVPTKGGEALLIEEITKEGGKKKPAFEALTGKESNSERDVVSDFIGLGLIEGLKTIL